MSFPLNPLFLPLKIKGEYKGVNKNFILFLIVLSGAALRLWGIFQPNLHLWDERFHALVAKNIALHWWVPTFYFQPLLEYDPSNWQGNHIWLHKPPLGLWLGALSMKIFGISEWAYRLPSFFFGTFSILLTYWIGKRLFPTFLPSPLKGEGVCEGEKIALVATFFHSISGWVLIFNSGTYGMDNIDNALFFFVQLSIFFWLRFLQEANPIGSPPLQWGVSAANGGRTGGSDLFFSGIAMGLGLLSKSYPALLSWGIFVSLMVFKEYRTKKHLFHSLWMLAVALLLFVPWQLYAFFQWPQEFGASQKVLWGHFFEAQIPGRDKPFYHFRNLPKDYGEFVLLAIPLFFYFLYKERKENLWIVSLWFLVPYIVFSLARTKITTLVYYCAPSIFLTLAVVSHFFWEKREKKSYLALLLIGWLLTLRASGEKLIQIGTGLFAVPKTKLLEQVSAIQGKAVLFNSPEYTEIMFFTDHITAYPFLPTEAQINNLAMQNFALFIVNQPSQDFVQWQKNLSPKLREKVKFLEPIVYNERIGLWSRIRKFKFGDLFRKAQ